MSVRNRGDHTCTPQTSRCLRYYRSHNMRGESDFMHGFDAGEENLLTPPVQVEEPTREQMVRIVAAIVSGATPEEITGYMADGFPDEIEEILDRPLERDEMVAHVDLLLGALQTPRVTTG